MLIPKRPSPRRKIPSGTVEEALEVRRKNGMKAIRRRARERREGWEEMRGRKVGRVRPRKSPPEHTKRRVSDGGFNAKRGERWKIELTVVDKEPKRHPNPTRFPPTLDSFRRDSNGESWEDRESDEEDAGDGDVDDSVSTEDLHGGGGLFGG